MNRMILFGALLCGMLILAGLTSAQTEYLLEPLDRYDYQDFGIAAALDGDDALIGSCPHWDYGDWPGSAYIMHWNGSSWKQQIKLEAWDKYPRDEFGENVALKNGWAAVGAKRQNGTGAIYMFKKDNENWVQWQKLTPGDPANVYLLCTVDLDGRTLIAGDGHNTVDGVRSGAAYIFEYDGDQWQQSAKLEPDFPIPGSEAGYAVTISGNRAAVGANGIGTVYLYEKAGAEWHFSAKLTPPFSGPHGQFGFKLDMDGDNLAVSAITLADPASETGGVFMYHHNGSSWVSIQKLQTEAPVGGQAFGASVSISGKRLLIGCSQYHTGTPGSAYLYHQAADGQWVYETTFSASNGESGNHFGIAVATDGKNALIGANHYNSPDHWAGAAYVYPLTPLNQPPVAVVEHIDPVEGTSPEGASVTLDGSNSYDPDGDLITFAWSAEGITFDDAASAKPAAVFPYGKTRVYLTVNDGQLNSQPAFVEVEVVDTTPPIITVTLSPAVLWPANHKMVDIKAVISASDNRDPAPAVVLLSITSNEAADAKGGGDGHTLADIQFAQFGVYDDAFQLCAERSGGSTGRIYTVTYQATDCSGWISTVQSLVTVPHDQGGVEEALAVTTLPERFGLQQNYPNPFNPSTWISFTLPAPEFVTLTIHDASGRLVRTLLREYRGAGSSRILWEAVDNDERPVAAGLYICTIQAGQRTASRKMLYIK